MLLSIDESADETPTANAFVEVLAEMGLPMHGFSKAGTEQLDTLSNFFDAINTFVFFSELLYQAENQPYMQFRSAKNDKHYKCISTLEGI